MNLPLELSVVVAKGCASQNIRVFFFFAVWKLVLHIPVPLSQIDNHFLFSKTYKKIFSLENVQNCTVNPVDDIKA